MLAMTAPPRLFCRMHGHGCCGAKRTLCGSMPESLMLRAFLRVIDELLNAVDPGQSLGVHYNGYKKMECTHKFSSSLENGKGNIRQCHSVIQEWVGKRWAEHGIAMAG